MLRNLFFYKNFIFFPLHFPLLTLCIFIILRLPEMFTSTIHNISHRSCKRAKLMFDLVCLEIRNPAGFQNTVLRHSRIPHQITSHLHGGNGSRQLRIKYRKRSIRTKHTCLNSFFLIGNDCTAVLFSTCAAMILQQSITEPPPTTRIKSTPFSFANAVPVPSYAFQLQKFLLSNFQYL